MQEVIDYNLRFYDKYETDYNQTYISIFSSLILFKDYQTSVTTIKWNRFNVQEYK